MSYCHHTNLFCVIAAVNANMIYCFSGLADLSHWNRLIGCCNGRGGSLIEAVFWWIVISVPINIASIIFAMEAPTYDHSEANGFDYDYEYHSIYQTMLENMSMAETFSLYNHLNQLNQSELVNCYEDNESQNVLLVRFDFWVSGVVLLGVGLGGMIGNVLTLLALVSESQEGSGGRNSFYKLLIYMAVVDSMLIVACVTEFSILNILWGHWPYWFVLIFPHVLHPFKVRKKWAFIEAF